MTKEEIQLIVMLTYQDMTVADAAKIFETCRESKAVFWGMKEEGIPVEEMKALFSEMKECGKRTFLEVVAYTEKDGIKGAQTAAECGCDYLMGTMFSETILQICKEQGMKYLPFVGKVAERPSVLSGDAKEMIREANRYIAKGAYGIDLLGFRYQGNAEKLIREVVSGVDGPVCVAGSIQSYERIDIVKNAGAWTYTVGSAFFENRFRGTFREQVDKLCEYNAGERWKLERRQKPC